MEGPTDRPSSATDNESTIRDKEWVTFDSHSEDNKSAIKSTDNDETVIHAGNPLPSIARETHQALESVVAVIQPSVCVQVTHDPLTSESPVTSPPVSPLEGHAFHPAIGNNHNLRSGETSITVNEPSNSTTTGDAVSGSSIISSAANKSFSE